MKIRRKNGTGPTYEAVEESGRFYIYPLGDVHFALPKTEWEPVSKWEDVTKDCVVDERGNVMLRSTFYDWELVALVQPNYKLRKRIALGADGERNDGFFVMMKR